MSKPVFILGLTNNISSGITADISFPSGLGIVPTHIPQLTGAQKAKALAITIPLTITKLIRYFRITDSDGNPISKFNPPVEIVVKYTSAEWELAYDEELKRPRIAYLVWKDEDENWAGHWVEFIKEIKNVKTPGSNGDPHGYLILKIPEIEDPLIGGC